MNGMKFGNPAALIFIGLGFGVGVFGVSLLLHGNAELGGAGTYGILAGGLSLIFGSIWNYLRGETYWAAICSFLGLWITFFFMYVTSAMVAPQGVALFAFGVIIPVAMMLVPAIKLKVTVLTLTFLSVIGLALFVALGNLPIAGVSALTRVAGVFGILTTLLLWYQGVCFFRQMVQEMTGAIRSPE